MDSSLHSHIVGIYLQDRIETANAARLARDAAPPRRLRMPRLRARRSVIATPARRLDPRSL